MNPKQIDYFFRTLDKQLNREARVILTGAGAGALWGGMRPSMGIDFAIELLDRKKPRWPAIEQALQKTTPLTAIPANYAEDISRWGMISLLNYRRHTAFYKKMGRLQVTILKPEYWSIGKLARYLDPDIKDMIQVFRRQKVSCSKLCEVWGKALKASPNSAALSLFRKQVEHFLHSRGKQIWGSRFQLADNIRVFRRCAGLSEISGKSGLTAPKTI